MQPWLSQDDAQQELYDGYVYRGVLAKRPGYNYFATGEKGGTPYTESRIVDHVPVDPLIPYEMDGLVDSANRTFTTTVPLANTPLRRGSFVVSSATPVQSLTDNGYGYFLDTALNILSISLAGANPAITTTVNHGYTTGDEVILSGIAGSSELNSRVAYTITVTGLATFTLDGVDSADISPYTSDGTVQLVVGTIDYTSGVVSVTFPLAPTAGLVTAAFDYFPGLPVMMVANFYTASNIRQLIVADTMYVNRFNPTTNRLDKITQSATYTGDEFNFFSWVNYETATDTPRLLFSNNVDVIQSYEGSGVTAYVPTHDTITALRALLIFNFKDRLVLLRTTESVVLPAPSTTTYPRRIRISGTGANCDNFNTSAPGAGFIDIPDNTWIMGAAYNRDDLIIFTEGSTWALKYTGNDTTPFVLAKIDESRGSGAPYAAITYLNRTTAASPRALIVSDGYQVQRMDEEIPDFSFSEIDPKNFQLCFAGSVDEDKDHYLIYPTPDAGASQRILVTNYEEDNFAIYRLPLSCMGNFIAAFDITWNDLIRFNNWAELAAEFGNWFSFAFTEGQPFSIGGGHKGEIWRLNLTEQEDNPVKIRNITIIDVNTAEVTTDWNNYSENANDSKLGKDTIFITGVAGMLEINNCQYQITQVLSATVFRIKINPLISYSAFSASSIGVAVRVIPFESLFKQFNPYVNQDRKVRCGWLYMYVNAATTKLQRQVAINGATQANPCVISTVTAHNFENTDQISIFGVNGMEEINNATYNIIVTSPTSFSLTGVNSTGFGAYTSGGYATVTEKCKATIEVITDDRKDITQTNYDSQNPPYQGSLTNLAFEDGFKKWYKVYINQVGKFIQFRVKNLQAGAKIEIQAMMPGFQPVGRLI